MTWPVKPPGWVYMIAQAVSLRIWVRSTLIMLTSAKESVSTRKGGRKDGGEGDKKRTVRRSMNNRKEQNRVRKLTMHPQPFIERNEPRQGGPADTDEVA